MPNHVHVLIRPLMDLPSIIRSWKGYTGHWAMKNNGTLDLNIPLTRFWMEDYWDRFIRNEKHLQNTLEYIHNNPVKAGLCAKPENWSFGSAGLPPRINPSEAEASRSQ